MTLHEQILTSLQRYQTLIAKAYRSDPSTRVQILNEAETLLQEIEKWQA